MSLGTSQHHGADVSVAVGYRWVIDTTATVTIEKLDSGFAVTTIHLQLKAKIPGADQAKFDLAAKNAKEGCPISKLFNAKITLDAQLES